MIKEIVTEIKNIKKDYGKGNVIVHALNGINMKINKGDFIAMAGPSGSGKTTLLNLIGTLDNPTSGYINIQGKNIHKLSLSEQSRLRRDYIGFIFQSHNLIPVLTVLENTEYILMLQGKPLRERREIARNILKDVGLGEMLDRRPNELSGGQRQRVAIARAIASKPTFVLADEPTASLDSRTAKGLLDIMQRLNEEKGITFLFSTHDTAVMKRSKKLMWLRDGRIDYEGLPEDFELP